MQWKVIIGFALFGAIISLIAGIAGGNPFGIILLRSLVSTLLFGGLGIGILFIFKRFFPGLLSEAPQEGGRVDIVIDDELEMAVPELASSPQEAAPESVDGAEPGPAEPSADGVPIGFPGDLSAEVETEVSPVSADEVVEEISAVLDLNGEETGEMFNEDPLSETSLSESAVNSEAPLEELQPHEPADDQPFSSTSQEGVDTLPEMGSFDGFEAAGSRAGLDELGQAQVESIEGQDVETLTKAIRTVMKRDEGG